MKNLEKLESQFKSGAEKHEVTPPPFIWDAVNKELPKEKANRRGLFFWLLCGTFVSAIALLSIDRFTAVESQSADLSKATEFSAIQPTVSKAKLAVNPHSNTTVDDKIMTESLSGSMEPRVPNTVSSQAHATASSSTQNRNDEKARDESDNQSIPTTKQYTTLSQGHRKVTDIRSTTPIVHNSSQTDSKPTNPLGNKNAMTESNTRPTILQKGLNARAEFSLAYVPVAPAMTLPFYRKTLIPSLALVSDYSPSTEKNLAQISSGIFYQINTLLGTHDTNLSNVSSGDSFYRNESESNWYTWGAKARVGYQFSNGLMINTGIDFIESRDRFDLRGQTLVPTSTQLTTTALRYFSVGDITYRQLNIPLTIGLERVYKRFIYGVQGTAMLNVWFGSEGKIQTGPATITRVEELGMYKNSLGLGYSGSLILGNQITESSTLYLRPTFARYAATTTVDNTYGTSNMIQYYMELGLRRTLN